MLQLSDLALRRGPKRLLEHTNLGIYPGQKIGVTGANGTGKTSLFLLILGDLQPDAGECRVPEGWVIAHVLQQTPSDTRSAIDYVLDGDRELRSIETSLAEAATRDDGQALAELHLRYENIDGYTAPSRAQQLLHGLGFTALDSERAVDEFSGGWRMRLNLARALMCRSDLLLLDEPTNHLDLDAVIWLEGWLRDYRGTLLLISHDRDFLDNVASHILYFGDQRATLYSGNYSQFERARAAELALRQAERVKQQREIAHMQSFVDRFRYKASKARQAQSRLKALRRMETIAAAHVDSPFRFAFRPPAIVPSPLLRMEGITVGYNGTAVLAGVRLSIEPGDRIGLLGPNGAGKSTLIKLLAERLAPIRGEFEPARGLRTGYFAQHQLEQLNAEQSPLQHLLVLEPQAREADLRVYLGGFGFSGDTVFMPTGPFSGGEKSRLALALLVYRRPNLLLLDEPTNHLDLEMRQALAAALQDFDGAMVIVSHDRHLLRVTSDELLLVNDGSVANFDGSLDDYPTWLARQNRVSEGARPKADAEHTAAARKEKKRREAEQREQLKPLRRKMHQAEQVLAKLQARRDELDLQLADQSLYEENNRQRLQKLLAEQASVANGLAAAEAIWLEACETMERLES